MSSTKQNGTAMGAEIPRTGLAGFKANWKADLIAGFSVSLIALPLCLGIAKASEFPAIAGIFTAIVGGLIASRLCGSFVTISGPAAGLIAINVAAVTTLGGTEIDPITKNAIGYPFALAAIVVAGLFVMLFGLLKVGKLSDFFPSAAVHGMLAAIGIIIIVKQFFPAIGVPAPKGELLEMIAEMPGAFLRMEPVIVVIAGLSIAILIAYPRIKNKWIKLVPAPMWVLLMAIPMSFAFDLIHTHTYWFAGAEHKVDAAKILVQLPDKITDGFVFPNFGKIATSEFWVAVMTIALVSGLESLLSAKAVDMLDPWRRKSNLNKDLVALGAGSSVAAAIGGLPMISEIVRSSANVSNGARTPWANFFHGGFLLIFLLLLKPIIMDIPNAALAAMLIFTGFRLASPKEFKHMAEIGWRQLTVFVATIVVVIAVDLLVGILAGIVVEMALNLFFGGKTGALFKAKLDVEGAGKPAVTLKVNQSLTFTNYLSLKKQIAAQTASAQVILDFTNCTLVDHTALTNLSELQSSMSGMGRELIFKNLELLKPSSAHPLAPRSAVAGYVPAKEEEKLSTPHQEEIMVFAAVKGFHYTAEPTKADVSSWTKGFSYFSGKQVQRVSNLLARPNYVIAEVTTTSGAQLTLSEEREPVLIRNIDRPHVPSFSLLIETNFDKVAERFGAQDIDFDDFPIFSDRFLLLGQDEAAIRQYFTPAILKFHEAFLDFMVESRGDAFLIRSTHGGSDAADLENLLNFAEKLYANLKVQSIAMA